MAVVCPSVSFYFSSDISTVNHKLSMSKYIHIYIIHTRIYIAILHQNALYSQWNNSYVNTPRVVRVVAFRFCYSLHHKHEYFNIYISVHNNTCTYCCSCIDIIRPLEATRHVRLSWTSIYIYIYKWSVYT